MDGVKTILRNAAIPDLPQEVRTDFVVASAATVQKQGRWLFVGLLLTCPFAALATPEAAGWFVRWGLPTLMALYCLLGLKDLFKENHFPQKPWRAERFMVQSWASSLIGAVISTTWAVACWSAADPGVRLHFPVILVMGALATAYCMASIRAAAVTHLVIDIGVIATLMFLTGSTLDIATAVSLCVAGVFQWRMINAHHNQVIELLMLERKSQQLALTDPLTGLLNRRALLDFAEDLGEQSGQSRLLLIDIDCFKVINDTHGHIVCDDVLRYFAAILMSNVKGRDLAARYGGEEFALILPETRIEQAHALCSHIMDQLEKSRLVLSEGKTPIGQLTASFGISQFCPDDTPEKLLTRADDKLYEAKNAGRNRIAR